MRPLRQVHSSKSKYLNQIRSLDNDFDGFLSEDLIWWVMMHLPIYLAWPFTILQNDNITMSWDFFRLTAPRCPGMAAGAVSLRKSHDIIILSFGNIVKGQANYATNVFFMYLKIILLQVQYKQRYIKIYK